MFDEVHLDWPIPGTTKKQRTGCGSLYITVAGKRTPQYIQAILGHQGTCIACHNFALSRAITIGLKYGAPIEEYIKHLRGIRCEAPVLGGSLSCPDAISRVLEEVSGVQFSEGTERASESKVEPPNP